ncbi:hypothetical protein AGMMS50293_20710 [Spirochaetia bacterium]|nr:hypothetical protein AGMMS50293_20710 [Spirochaetia bacterium]
MKKMIRIVLLASAFLTLLVSCPNPAGDDAKEKTSEHLIAGQFSSNRSSGAGVFYADYTSNAARATTGTDQQDLSGKVEDGDIVFTLNGYIDSEGAFFLSAGSSVLLYQITGGLQGATLVDAKVTISIKNGDQWQEHQADASQTETVKITKPDSPGQIASKIPATWQGGWQGKENAATAYDTIVINSASIVIYPAAGGTPLIISLLELETINADTVDFIILGKDSAANTNPAYYKCRLEKSGSLLLFRTYNNSEMQVMINNALQMVKEYNVASAPGASVKTITMSSTNRTTLTTAISAAAAAKAGIITSANGSDVESTAWWVTAGELAALNAAISAAQTVYDNAAADQAAVDNAVTILQGAVVTFNGQKKAGLITTSIYITGTYTEGSTQKPAYWKGSTRYNLSINETDPQREVNGMALADNDIYIVGKNNGACYWKNGVKYNLSVPAGTAIYDSFANDITVSGSDVYIAGYYYNGDHNVACYWKNGVRTDIGSSGYIYAIAISGGDVYITGTDTAEQPCYWKNGNIFNLSGTGCPQDIAIVGTDVYVTGFDGSSLEMVGYYWRNGTRYTLSGSGIGGSEIAVSGTNVYIAGAYRSGEFAKACYWLNGIQVVLPATANESWANRIAIYDSDVYILGSNGGYGFGENGPIPPPQCYWKNGVRTDLPAEIENAAAIAVK